VAALVFANLAGYPSSARTIRQYPTSCDDQNPISRIDELQADPERAAMHLDASFGESG